MLGWMLIFTSMVFGATLSALKGGVGSELGMTLSVVFGFLLLVSALTFVLRGRA
jgi:hypothetical protein